MFPFGKKKQEEPEQEIGPIRDLKPKNKAKRKEPVKPWGRAERLLIFTVLGITVGVSVVLSAIARGGLSVPNLSVQGPKIASGGISFGETYIFEKKTNDDDCCGEQVLKFRELTDDLTGTYGFYVIRLSSSEEYGYNEEEIFQAASLIKLPTIVALYMDAEDGNVDLDAYHVLKDSDKLGGNGFLASYKEGTKISYRDLAKYSLHNSDNTAFNIIENYLGDRKIQGVIASLGMKDTSIYDNLTSPKDIAFLLKKIYKAEIMNEENSKEVISFMKDTPFASWIVAGLPEGTDVASKYGREIRVVNDAAIINSTKPYVLVVMSKDVNELEADKILPTISETIFQQESSQ